MAQAVVTQTIKDAKGKTLAVFYDDGNVRIDGGILSYPHLDKPWGKATKANPHPTLTYSCSVILNKKRYRPVKDALVEHNKQLMKELRIEFVKDENKYMIDGDKSGKPENADSYVIRTREQRKPFTKGMKNENLTEAETLSQLYGGCEVSVLIRPWAQNSAEWGKRLNCGITGVRKLADGEPFGEGRIGDEDVADRFSGAAPDEENGGYDDDDDPDSL